MTLIARRPSQELVDLVGALAGSWRGYTALCRCPTHTDQTPSLSLRQGDRGIIVHCFAGCAASDVLRDLRNIRPTGRYDPPKHDHRRCEANVARIWDSARDIAGTLAERYLASRGLPPDLPDIRFHPSCPLGPKPRTQFKPALLVGVRDPYDLSAIQRIFLDPTAARYTEKLMLGHPGKGAWRGNEAGPTLAIAEGFETAASYTKLTGTHCWASLGAARLSKIAIPSAVELLLIAEDDDPEGRRAAELARATHRLPGRRVKRCSPRPHGDWSDALMKG